MWRSAVSSARHIANSIPATQKGNRTMGPSGQQFYYVAIDQTPKKTGTLIGHPHAGHEPPPGYPQNITMRIYENDRPSKTGTIIERRVLLDGFVTLKNAEYALDRARLF